MTDRYSKLTKGVPPYRTIASHIAPLLMYEWIIPHGIPMHVLTDNGTKFVRNFLESVCIFFGTKPLTTTAYYSLTNGQPEQLIKMILVRLRHCVAEHQRDGDIYVQPLTYTYNTKLHRTTNLPPFSSQL